MIAVLRQLAASARSLPATFWWLAAGLAVGLGAAAGQLGLAARLRARLAAAADQVSGTRLPAT